MKNDVKMAYTPRNRKDISNPFHGNIHEENLKLAGVKQFTKFTILHLPGGLIRIEPVDSKK